MPVSKTRGLKPTSQRSLRIIGGEWRSRVIEFADVTAIRPTPDRVRETLFNWLQGELHGARCLELFAGSGILSFEALSRGASHCTIIDQSPKATEQIDANLKKLGAKSDQYHCLRTDGVNWLAVDNTNRFDVIFLDPPFGDDNLSSVIDTCARQLAADGFIYVESPQSISETEIPSTMSIYRQKRAGAVHYALLQRD